VKRLDGGFYTYDGLSSMLKRSIETANVRRKARGIEPMKSFGFRDLKGKGATDMYFLAKVPIEQIQQLLGHASKTTTEIYIKQRWRETASRTWCVPGRSCAHPFLVEGQRSRSRRVLAVERRHISRRVRAVSMGRPTATRS
jgi:hypothetical protein